MSSHESKDTVHMPLSTSIEVAAWAETNTDFSRLMEGNVPTCGGRGSFRGYDDLPEYGGAERYMDNDFSRASTMRCTGLDKLFR